MADSTTNIVQIEASQAQKEVTANGLFGAASPAMYGAMRPESTAGLVWGYYGGRWGGTLVANGTFTLDASTTNYVVLDKLTGDVIHDTPSDNLWADTANYAHLYEVVTGTATITSYEDHRQGPDGIFAAASSIAAADVQGTGLDADAAGFRGIPQNAQTGNYTTVAADAGKHIYHANGAGSGDTYTIASNASVAYEIGTAITFVNMDTNIVTIAISSDTMYLAGTGATGSRTLANYGVATAIKLTSTTWIISGTGLS